MKSTYNRVKRFLEDFDYLRDDLKRLTLFIHREDMVEQGFLPSQLSYMDMEELYLADRLTSPNYIDRMKRKVERDFPKLQGKTWKKRQEHSKDVARAMVN